MLAEADRINSKKELKEWIEYESKNFPMRRGIRNLFPVSEYDVLRKHQIVLRKTEFYSNTGNKVFTFLYKLRLYRIQNKYAIHIPINTCGKGLKIMHLGSILINEKARVGKDCAFHINTALVAGGTTNDAPCLDDGVVCGVGAVVLGGVHIAKNIAIGANAVVNKSFEENDIAIAGIPAQKISNNGRASWNRKLD